MDHLLYPCVRYASTSFVANFCDISTLTDAGFTTEVYHLNGKGGQHSMGIEG